MTKKLSVVACVAMAALACSEGVTDVESNAAPNFSHKAGGGGGGGGGTRTYEVTIKNLTASQPFSPGVVVTHTKKRSVFRVGESASEGIRLIAEDGVPSTAVTELDGAQGVHDVVATSSPVGCNGCGAGPFPGPLPTTLTVEITARGSAKRLSLAVMLICTNDGFTGLDGIKLPGGFKPETHLVVGYDAGTEANDELFTSIVDPCGGIGPVAVPGDGLNTRTATSGVITSHPGIAGIGDLDPAVYGWGEPVAEITIQRMRK